MPGCSGGRSIDKPQAFGALALCEASGHKGQIVVTRPRLGKVDDNRNDVCRRAAACGSGRTVAKEVVLFKIINLGGQSRLACGDERGLAVIGSNRCNAGVKAREIAAVGDVDKVSATSIGSSDTKLSRVPRSAEEGIRRERDIE